MGKTNKQKYQCEVWYDAKDLIEKVVKKRGQRQVYPAKSDIRPDVDL